MYNSFQSCIYRNRQREWGGESGVIDWLNQEVRRVQIVSWWRRQKGESYMIEMGKAINLIKARLSDMAGLAW